MAAAVIAPLVRLVNAGAMVVGEAASTQTLAVQGLAAMAGVVALLRRSLPRLELAASAQEEGPHTKQQPALAVVATQS